MLFQTSQKHEELRTTDKRVGRKRDKAHSLFS